MKRILLAILVAGIGVTATACSPEVGSPEWCEAMKEKPKAEWTANEAKEYSKNCLF